MKPIRNAAAKPERQNTTVQGSSVPEQPREDAAEAPDHRRGQHHPGPERGPGCGLRPAAGAAGRTLAIART